MQARLLGVPAVDDFNAVVFDGGEVGHALEVGGGLFLDLRGDVGQEDDDGVGIEGGEALAVEGGPAGIFDDVLAAGELEDVVEEVVAADGGGGGFIAEKEAFDGSGITQAL